MDDGNFLQRSLLMVSGLLIWSVQFGMVYTVTALACVRGFADTTLLGFGIVPLAVVAATLAAMALTAALTAQPFREVSAGEDRKPVDAFLAYTTVTLGALSLIAIVLTGLPALLIPACE